MEIGCLGRLHGANLILTAILEDTANPSWNDFPEAEQAPLGQRCILVRPPLALGAAPLMASPTLVGVRSVVSYPCESWAPPTLPFTFLYRIGLCFYE